jgi:hypothetical protein
VQDVLQLSATPAAFGFKTIMNKEQELIRKKSPVSIRNKKASFEYFFVETYTAGIVLTGTEIKSIRLGKASLVDTFCYINNGEVWVKGMNVSPYFYGSAITRRVATASCCSRAARYPNSRRLPSSPASPLCPYSCSSTNTDAPRWTSRSVAVRRSTTSVRL